MGNSHIMLSDDWPDMSLLGPLKRGGATASLLVYLPDVDAALARAGSRLHSRAAAGGSVLGRSDGTLVDPFGHRWSLATHVEDVSAEEMQRRMSDAFQNA